MVNVLDMSHASLLVLLHSGSSFRLRGDSRQPLYVNMAPFFLPLWREGGTTAAQECDGADGTYTELAAR